MRRRTWLAALMIAAPVLAAYPAAAHHSFSMFETSKQLTLKGAVHDFQWGNPHIWLELTVPDGQGGSKQWSIEGSSPNTLRRHGWSRETFKPGDSVTVVIYPLKDGRGGGAFIRATFADGHEISEAPGVGANSPRVGAGQ
jgi:hypothetical protein